MDAFFIWTNETILPALLLLLLSLLLVYYWSIATYGYWTAIGIPSTTTSVPFFGDIWPLIRRRENYPQMIARIYRSLNGLDYGGYYEMREPILMIRHPKLVEDVTVKNEHYFDGRIVDQIFNPDECVTELNPLSSLLFVSTGKRRKNLRVKLCTIFTTNSMNSVVPSIFRIARDVIGRCVPNTNTNTNVQTMTVRYALKSVVCLLFRSDDYDIIAESSIRLMTEHVRSNYSVRMMVFTIHRRLLGILGIADFPKEFTDAFIDVIRGAIERRERLTDQNYNDFLQKMIDFKNDVVNKNVKFDDIDIAANIFGIFLAAYETTANSLTFCLHELAFNPVIQDKVRQEIQTVTLDFENETAFDVIKNLKYTNTVILETLRKYTVMPSLFRLCTKDYTIPGTTHVIPAGTKILIPNGAIHLDPAVFPDPDKFDPDRFLPENISKLNKYCYLPFGIGPRYCLGQRFVHRIMKIMLVEIISNYIVYPSTDSKYEVEYQGGKFLTIPKEEIHLRFKRIET